MNLFLIFTVALATMACFAVSGSAQESPASSSFAIDPFVAKARTAALAMQRKSWEQGVLAQAFFEEGNDDLMVQMAEASLLYPSRDGLLVAASGGAPVDPVMLGEALWRAAEVTNDPSLRKAADNMLQWCLKTGPRAADGTIFHTGQTIWSDSFHTTPPFLAYAGQYDEALKQIEGHRKRLYDPAKKLVSHKWNEARQQFDRRDFWGSGNGWTAAAIARVIRYLPAERKADRDMLAAFLKDLIDGCLAHQTPEGMFHDIIDNPATYIDVNVAQMLAFSIYESVAGGWLSADYLKSADKMRDAARAKVDKNGFVQGVAGVPNFNKPGVSPEGQAFFLMMEAAHRKAAEARPRRN